MSEIKPGIYRNVKITDYHSGDGLSATGLCELMRSPLHYITSLKTPHKETPALKLGSATHCAILEPERFAREYIKAGNLDRRTKEGKAAWLEIEQSGKIVLTPEEYDKVTSMTLAIRNHEVAKLTPMIGAKSLVLLSVITCVSSITLLQTGKSPLLIMKITCAK